jgi:predicted RNase H-related nuclease YkuK (DUF458 family)
MVPFVTLKLDKVYELKFGMGTMYRYEQLTGGKIQNLVGELSITTVINVIWAMLLQDNKDITQEEVIKLVDDHVDNMMDLINTVTNAITSAFAVSNKKTKSKNAPAKK